MSELRDMLEGSVERIFSDLVTKQSIEAAEHGTWQEELWAVSEREGLVRPHVREVNRGSGGGWIEAFTVLYASGRHSLPLPLAEAMFGAWLLDQAGLEIPAGPMTVCPHALDAAALDDSRLNCMMGSVPWGRVARNVVFVVKAGNDVHVGLVPMAAAAAVRHEENLAREPRDTLTFEGADIDMLAPAALVADAVPLYGAMVRSAQMAGAMQSLLEQSVRYAGERVQFGRTLSHFQVIQQELAKLAGDSAAAAAASEAAFTAAARYAADPEASDEPRFEIAVAKTLIGSSVERATSIAHQTHGAIGFTYEHGLHFATRRLWSWRSEFGTDIYWAAELGRSAISRGADELWEYITSRVAAVS